MILAVSPYHLTTREAPAMLSLLLAERVVTLLPSPLGHGDAASDRHRSDHSLNASFPSPHSSPAPAGSHSMSDDAGAASALRSRRARAEAFAAQLPRYRAFMRSWEWLVPLWQRGVVCGELGGLAPVDDAREACRVLARDGEGAGSAGVNCVGGRYASLASLMRPDLFDDEAHYLDTLAHDLNRAGPDPGVTVPVHAGLDWFAIRAAAAARARAAVDEGGDATGASFPPILVARPEPASIAQQAEARLARPVLAFAMPMLMRAGPRTILLARDLLQRPLATLRHALSAAIRSPSDAHTPPRARGANDASAADLNESALPALTRASREYAAAFQDIRTRLMDEDECDDNDIEMMEGTAKVSIVSLPSDAVLESSLMAMHRMMPAMHHAGARVAAGTRASQSDSPIEPKPNTAATDALAHRTPHAGERLLAAVIKVLGRVR